MIKFYQTLTNKRGDALAGYRVQVVDSDGASVSIYADASGTLFDGSVNYATADSEGLVEFYWEPESGAVLQTLDPAGNLIKAVADFAAVGGGAVVFTAEGTGAVERSALSKMREIVSPEDFGAVGNGVADDRAAFQAAFDYAASLGGADVLATATYRIVITDSVTDRGLIVKDDVRLLAKGATINLECTGDVYGIRLKNRSQVVGGTVAVTSSTTPGSQSIWHSCISVGDAYGYGGTVGAVSSFHNVSGWGVEDVTFVNARTSILGGVGFVGYGGVNNGRVVRPKAGDSSTAYGLVQFDWGFVGTITTSGSTAAEIAASISTSRTNFDAGTAYTTHPHDIEVIQADVGAFSGAGSIPIRLSGVYNFTVDGGSIDACTVAGVYHHAGDPGFEFAQASVKPFRHKRIVIRNMTVRDANNGNGFWADCKADNIATAVTQGYSPLLDPIQRSDIVFENCHTFSDGGASVAAGFRLIDIIGARLKDCLATGHSKGVLIDQGADEVKVNGGFFFGNRDDGIYAGHASDKPQSPSVSEVRAYQNGSAVADRGNVFFENCDNPSITKCHLGRAAETAAYGLRAENTAAGLTVEDNYVEAIKVGGTAYSIGASTDYAILKKFKNNTTNGVATPYGGANIVTEETDEAGRKSARAAKAALSSDITPSAGAWVAGSFIRYTDPAAGGYVGTLCTAGGSPGTWKRYATVEA